MVICTIRVRTHGSIKHVEGNSHSLLETWKGRDNSSVQLVGFTSHFTYNRSFPRRKMEEYMQVCRLWV